MYTVYYAYALLYINRHVPAGTSAKTFVHFGQLTNSGHFRQYDYGTVHNLEEYKRVMSMDNLLYPTYSAQI